MFDIENNINSRDNIPILENNNDINSKEENIFLPIQVENYLNVNILYI